MKSYELVTLDTINQGAAKELFDSNWKKLLSDIADPNKSPTKPRKLTLTITVLPDEQREGAATTVDVGLSLPKPVPHKSSVVLDGTMGGEVTAHVSQLKQPVLPSNVSQLNQEKKA